MTSFVGAVTSQTNSTTTLNGMAVNKSTSNKLVDLFFAIGASRNSIEQTVGLFLEAFATNSDIATRILLKARDAREGMGEREVFRRALRRLAVVDYKIAERVVARIPELGRWDDVVCVFGTPAEHTALEMIETALRDGDGLCAKWMPREGSKRQHYRAAAAKIRKHMGINQRTYRRLLVGLSETVEQQLSKKQYDQIEYEHVPSVAAARYQAAFARTNPDRYAQYRDSLIKGEAKINASAVLPHDIVKSCMRGGDRNVANEQWKSLPDWISSEDSFFPMIDVSGSMGTGVSGQTTAMDVAIGLGLYCAQRCKHPAFKDHFLTFSGSPEIINVAGLPLYEAVAKTRRAPWGMNTNLESAFRLILRSAAEHKVAPVDMPKYLIILSDMQFDQATRQNDTAQQMIEAEYARHGYEAPKVVFWNLVNYGHNAPVSFDKAGTVLVSGFNPSLMKTVLSAQQLDPLAIVLDAVSGTRYDY